MKKGQIVALCFIWLFIILIGAGIWRLAVQPTLENRAEQQKEEEHKTTIVKTGSESRYSVHINCALDSFSGYSPLRSEAFSTALSNKRQKVTLVDDGADYVARLKAIARGDIQMAVFTIDALIKASAELGDIPATIVAFIDETRGADAMVAYQEAVPNIDALNNPNIKFILTPNTPSETLGRVVMSHFGLHNLGKDPFIKAKDAADVYNRYRNSKPTDPQVYLLWEPYVTKMLENPNVQVVVDSSRFRGYIVDVIVASRDFLVKNEAAAKDFVEAYFRAFYEINQKPNGMKLLIANDAQQNSQPLNEKQVERLVNGIWWKNTSENFAHMGLNNDRPLQYIEDMIINLINVLLTTGAIDKDPTNGKPNLLYYDKLLMALKSENFHPGISPEKIRKDEEALPKLNEEQWKLLTPVGTLAVSPIVFARGTSRITEQSEITLNELIEKLKSWPQYYVIVRGNASLQGDIQANKELAQSRAKSTEQYLLDHGIHATRVKAVGVEPTGSTNVVFQLAYMPY